MTPTSPPAMRDTAPGQVYTYAPTLEDAVSALDISVDHGRAIVGSHGGDAILLDTGRGTAHTLVSHPGGVLTAAWSPDGVRVATGGLDGLTRLYDQDGIELATVQPPLSPKNRRFNVEQWVNAVAWSPSSRWLAIACGRRLGLVDADAGTAPVWLPAVSSTITDLIWTPDSKRIGVTSYGGMTWFEPARLPTMEPARTLTFKGSPLAATIAPNGKWVCAGFQDSTVHIWRLWSGEDLAMRGYPAKIDLLDFRSDSRRMACACAGDVTIWDFSGKGPGGTAPSLCVTRHDAPITAVQWQPGGAYVAAGHSNGAVSLWAGSTMSSRQALPLRHLEVAAGVTALKWSADGQRVLLGCDDGSVAQVRMLDAN